MKAVVMAGGKGSRISSLFPDIPKPMIPIDGKPVLWYIIRQLARSGITEIFLPVHYLAEKIINYFGDGSKYGVHIEYFIENEPLGSAGALLCLKDKLDEEFLLLNGDLFFDVDFERLFRFHKERGGQVTLFTHPNTHPFDSTLIFADENHRVVDWMTKEEKRPQWYKNRVNAGIHVIKTEALPEREGQNKKRDLDRDVIRPLIPKGQVFCYDSSEYVKDMGTPERYQTVCDDYRKGKTAKKNMKRLQKAVFLDRDGTINEKRGFLRKEDDLVLMPEAAKAIKIINESTCLAIVATNQPVIARGEVTEKTLRTIHDKMETLLGREGAYLDDIYFCPHHPDRGFEGEIKELKTECGCRKPKPGMLLKAAEDHHIDLSASWMIGDSMRDIGAGKTAGCKTVLIGSGEYGQTASTGSLLDAVRFALQGEMAGAVC